jgi:hypothetical protein
MDVMYAIINKNNRVVKAFVGDIKSIKDTLIKNEEKAIQVTLDNSPINQGDYYDGTKFVKELYNV